MAGRDEGASGTVERHALWISARLARAAPIGKPSPTRCRTPSSRPGTAPRATAATARCPGGSGGSPYAADSRVRTRSSVPGARPARCRRRGRGGGGTADAPLEYVTSAGPGADLPRAAGGAPGDGAGRTVHAGGRAPAPDPPGNRQVAAAARPRPDARGAGMTTAEHADLALRRGDARAFADGGPRSWALRRDPPDECPSAGPPLGGLIPRSGGPGLDGDRERVEAPAQGPERVPGGPRSSEKRPGCWSRSRRSREPGWWGCSGHRVRWARGDLRRRARADVPGVAPLAPVAGIAASFGGGADPAHELVPPRRTHPCGC